MAERGEVATELIDRARLGDRSALGDLLARHEQRLRWMVRLRIDPRLRGRLDPSDVIQESFLEAAERFHEFVKQPELPFYFWLRFLTLQKLTFLHRHHLKVHARNAGREVSLSPVETNSAVLAAQLVGRHSTPSKAAMRAELSAKLEQAISQLEPLDREVLALRHFEQLSNSETAKLLSLKESAASQRYARALLRLKDVLAAPPGGAGGL